MSSPSYEPVSTMGSVPVPLDSESARSFYADRIALFHKTVGLLSSGFLIFGNAVDLLHPERDLSNVLDHDDVLHLLAATISLTVWGALRRYEPPARVLPWLDSLSTIAVMAVYMWMFVHAVAPLDARLDLVLMLISMIYQMARAVIVPSTQRLTILTGVAVTISLLISTYVIVHKLPHPAAVPLEVLAMAGITLWSIVTVTVAAVASRVIYGLRQRVRKAEQLGQYTLEEKIGEGGMGSVYRARHALLRRPTAIKLLPAERAGANNLSRFEREVQLTSRLTHPNTVAIYDYGHTPDGIFYYAMEYLDGLDLQDVVAVDGPQDPSRVVRVLRQVCGALAEAHGIGLVHRDIKPANIVLCERGNVPDTVKVVDFGLVKELFQSGVDAQLSAVDALVGTPHYLSPEAIAAPDKVDARSDLYAVGAVAYYLLTGTEVFSGKNLVEVCGQHLHTAPTPPSERLGHPVPPKLERLVLHCLAKNPVDRPQTASALTEELDACGVPAWTDEQARRWWRETKLRASAFPPQPSMSTPSQVGMKLTIDMGKRTTR